MNSRTSILRLAISCLLLTIRLPAQDEIFVPANDVSFTISPERTRYRAGEQIILKYRITNISNAPLYTPQQWEVKCPRGSPHLWAWFENSSGKHFVPGYGGSCSPTGDPKTASERMSKEAILLKPGGHFDGTLQLDTTLFGGLKSGEYRIEANLSGWTQEHWHIPCCGEKCQPLSA